MSDFVCQCLERFDFLQYHHQHIRNDNKTYSQTSYDSISTAQLVVRIKVKGVQTLKQLLGFEHMMSDSDMRSNPSLSNASKPAHVDHGLYRYNIYTIN